MADGRGSGNAGDTKPKRKVKVVASRYAQSLNLPARRQAVAPPVPASALAAPVSAPASVPHALAPSTKRTAIAAAQVPKPAPVATSSGSVAERLQAFRQKKAAHEPTRTPTKVVKKARTEATASTMRLDVAAKQPQVPTTSAKDSETVELHESLYYQLCYVERLADQAFQKQEADATAQLAAVFAVVHEKTKALHSMERRWAHERNMFHLHTHLQDHGASLAHLPELLRTYGDQIRDLSRAIAATLHRLPMSDAHCSSSALDAAVQELTRTLEYTLSATLPTWESPASSLCLSCLHTNVAQLDALFSELQARLQQLGVASDEARSQAIGRLEQSTPLHGVEER